MTKQCFICKKTFPINMFYVTHNNRFFSYCKSCHIMKNKKQKFIYINKEDNYIKTTLRHVFSRARTLPKFKRKLSKKRMDSRSNFRRNVWRVIITYTINER
jgi:hypothetical protein